MITTSLHTISIIWRFQNNIMDGIIKGRRAIRRVGGFRLGLDGMVNLLHPIYKERM
jgi:hypothetical protein